MYVDTDVSFRVNPYPLLKGPFARFALVGQDETGHVNGVNIGFVYAQNARAGGPAHRVLNETVARMFAILEHAPGPVTQWDGDVARGAKEHLWDQHIYNDVVESAVFSRDLRRRSGARLIDPSGNERQAWNDAEVNAFPRDTDWESFEVVVRPTDVPLTKAGTKMALEPGRFQARGARLRCVGADVPGYATREEEAKIRALRASNVTGPVATVRLRQPAGAVTRAPGAAFGFVSGAPFGVASVDFFFERTAVGRGSFGRASMAAAQALSSTVTLKAAGASSTVPPGGAGPLLSQDEKEMPIVSFFLFGSGARSCGLSAS